MKKAHLLVTVLAMALAASSCGLTSIIGGQATPPPVSTTPSATLWPAPSVTRPALLIQYCDDDTGSYPRPYFQGANQLIADSLVGSVGINQEGVTLYATAITHNTFDPKNTLSEFQVPAFSTYPPSPTPMQATITDPLNAPRPTLTVVADANQTAIATYNAGIADQSNGVTIAQSALSQQSRLLTTWNPKVDDVGTSILGCFQLAATRFVNQPGVKLIYIASDLENNTDIDQTQDFVTGHRLKGVIVHVIFFYSQTAKRNDEKEHNWCNYLEEAGASTVLFSDPVTSPNLTNGSLVNVFNMDWSAQPTTCT